MDTRVLSWVSISSKNIEYGDGERHFFKNGVYDSF